jgi:hypothetical protein
VPREVQQNRCMLLHFADRLLHIEVQQIDKVQQEVQQPQPTEYPRQNGNCSTLLHFFSS